MSLTLPDKNVCPVVIRIGVDGFSFSWQELCEHSPINTNSGSRRQQGAVQVLAPVQGWGGLHLPPPYGHLQVSKGCHCLSAVM